MGNEQNSRIAEEVNASIAGEYSRETGIPQGLELETFFLMEIARILGLPPGLDEETILKEARLKLVKLFGLQPDAPWSDIEPLLINVMVEEIAAKEGLNPADASWDDVCFYRVAKGGLNPNGPGRSPGL